MISSEMAVLFQGGLWAGTLRLLWRERRKANHCYMPKRQQSEWFRIRIWIPALLCFGFSLFALPGLFLAFICTLGGGCVLCCLRFPDFWLPAELVQWDGMLTERYRMGEKGDQDILSCQAVSLAVARFLCQWPSLPPGFSHINPSSCLFRPRGDNAFLLDSPWSIIILVPLILPSPF